MGKRLITGNLIFNGKYKSPQYLDKVRGFLYVWMNALIIASIAVLVSVALATIKTEFTKNVTLPILFMIYFLLVCFSYTMIYSLEYIYKLPIRIKFVRGCFSMVIVMATLLMGIYWSQLNIKSVKIADIVGLLSMFASVLPLIRINKNSIRQETKWRQDIRKYLVKDLSEYDHVDGKKIKDLMFLLEHSVSNEAQRFVEINKSKLRTLKSVKTRKICNEHSLRYDEALIDTQLIARPYGRVTAIDFYVCMRCLNIKDAMIQSAPTQRKVLYDYLITTANVLLKYDWDLQSREPVFYFDITGPDDEEQVNVKKNMKLTLTIKSKGTQ